MPVSMTSVDLAEFYAENQKRGPQCGVARALLGLSPDDVQRLRAALAAADIQHHAIEVWLGKHGQPVGKGSVSRHRNKVCRCDR